MYTRKAVSTLFYIILIIIALIILGFIAYTWPDYNESTNPPWGNDNPTPQEVTSDTNIIDEKYIQLELPSEWRMLKETFVDVAEGYADEAYILQKEHFMIHINPSTGPVGGPEGGRFSEVTKNIPSASLVINTHPSPPCENSRINEINEKLIRGDLYVASDNTEEWCNKPATGGVWYGSYVSTFDSGYFGELKKLNLSDTDMRFLITYGYEGITDINDLPSQNSQKLNRMLEEMDEIVRSIVLK